MEIRTFKKGDKFQYTFGDKSVIEIVENVELNNLHYVGFGPPPSSDLQGFIVSVPKIGNIPMSNIQIIRYINSGRLVIIE